MALNTSNQGELKHLLVDTGKPGEDKTIEYFLGIDPHGRRCLSVNKNPGWTTHTVVKLKRSQVEEIVSIPFGDMQAIQTLLSQYY